MNETIKIRGARVHNLKNIDLDIPRNQLVVFTGLSGSGKSSLAFDTIYAEGQRRYVESLSAYARQFLEKLDKPDVDVITGLSPAISIDQKTTSHNPRSTVGTITEIYDYLRLLFASIGVPFCPECGERIQSQSIQEITDQVLNWPEETKVLILSPIVRGKKGEYKADLEDIRKQGFSRVRVDGAMYKLGDDIPMDKNKKHTIDIVVDRMSVHPDNRSRMFESIETAVRQAKGVVMVERVETGETTLFSEALSCPNGHVGFGEINPRLFSFNAPQGACKTCNGLGDRLDFDPELIFDDWDAPLNLSTQKIVNLDQTYYGRVAEQMANRHGFSLSKSYNELTEAQRKVLLYGEMHDEEWLNENQEWKSLTFRGAWEGVLVNLKRRYHQTQSENMRYFFRMFMTAKECQTCHGLRLNPYALNVRIQGKNIADCCQLCVSDLVAFIHNLKLTEKETVIARQILKEIRERLDFLNNVGLNYLSLSRKSGTLSGGESQRIRLATQIGSGLTGVIYVLDEPSIGLHQRDNVRLLETLKRLRDLGNTLIVVEHDEDTILNADYIVDIGPGAGVHGGEIVFVGTLDNMLKADTLTAQYINRAKQVPLPGIRRSAQEGHWLSVTGCRENNLKNIEVAFPLGTLTAVTGVSGSGKSSLINDILQKALNKYFYKSREPVGKHDQILGLEHIDKVITIDQSPIGRTPRSNPATYTGVFTPIRELFAQTREAKIHGYSPGRFSFNVKGGRCEACEGDGMIQIEMHFLSDVYVTCEVCKGKRYNDQTLEVTYKGAAIADVLDMTVDQALSLFENIPAIESKLKTLSQVGLGYIHLGQSATTLSGGEAQRIKLAKELSKRSTGKTMYLLDEPTTGLHFEDVSRLLHVLDQLVSGGNTVIVIEHNLDVVKSADYIIDLGPEGGEAGGTILATGTPEEIAQHPKSHTGQYLAHLLIANVPA